MAGITVPEKQVAIRFSKYKKKDHDTVNIIAFLYLTPCGVSEHRVVLMMRWLHRSGASHIGADNFYLAMGKKA